MSACLKKVFIDNKTCNSIEKDGKAFCYKALAGRTFTKKPHAGLLLI